MTKDYGFGSLGMGPLTGMLESMDFMKNAWSSFSLPSNLAPTMDVDELDRRITDLKAVEQWLSVNLTLLQSSIQAMEIQRGTIAAIQAFSESMASPGESGDAAARALDAVAAMQRAAAQAASEASGAAAGREAERRDNAAAGGRHSPVGDAAAQPRAGAEPRSQPPETPQPASARGEDTGDSAGSTPSAGARTARAHPASVADEISQAAAAAVNPSAWWNMLQSQFNQVAQAALAAAGPGAAPPGAKAPAPKSTASAAGRQSDPASPGPRAGDTGIRKRKTGSTSARATTAASATGAGARGKRQPAAKTRAPKKPARDPGR